MNGDLYARDEASRTVWPVPWHLDDTDGVEWRLRYGSHHDVFAASIVAAYHALVDPHITMTDAIEKLRHVRRAMVLFVPEAKS